MTLPLPALRRAVLAALLIFSVTLILGEDPPKGQTYQVIQKDRAFSVTEITIKPGDRIDFENADEVTHNVFSKSLIHPFNLLTQQPGQSKIVQFPDAGDIVVRCAIHPGMRLIIHVRP